MAKDKTIIERFADTVRDVAMTAAEAASEALKAEPPSRATDRAAAYVPLAGDGLVADPLMVPPVTEPRRHRKRVTTPRRAARKKPARATAGKSARKPAKKAVRNSSAATAKKAAKKSSTRRLKKAAGKQVAKTRKAGAKRRAAKSRRG